MEIKPIQSGMVIRCKTQKEANMLGDNLNSSQVTKLWSIYGTTSCYEIKKNNGVLELSTYGPMDTFTRKNITEFSDLILPGQVVDELHEEKEPEVEWVFKCFQSSNIALDQAPKTMLKETDARRYCEGMAKLYPGETFSYIPACRVKESE